MTDANKTSLAPKRLRRMAREPLSNRAYLTTPPAAKPESKASLIEDLLIRHGGASLNDLCQATGWLPYTCRAFLTGLLKKGRELERAKREDGVTNYRIAPIQIAA